MKNLTIKDLRPHIPSGLYARAVRAQHGNHLDLTIIREGEEPRGFYSAKSWDDWQETMSVLDSIKSINKDTLEVEFPEDAFLLDLEMVEECPRVAELRAEWQANYKVFHGDFGRRTHLANRAADERWRDALELFLRRINIAAMSPGDAGVPSGLQDGDCDSACNLS